MVGTKAKGMSRIERKGRPNKLKSRTFKRIFVRTPSGRTVVHFKKRKPGKQKCAGCGAVLGGTLRERPHKMRKIAKSKKIPSRAYAGYFCGKCLKAKIKAEVRK